MSIKFFVKLLVMPEAGMVKMKKRRHLIALAAMGIIYLWNQEPPEGMGMTNQFIGTYVCELDRNCYITAYSEGIFYYYNERVDLYCKGYFREFSEDTYELAGKKIKPQRILLNDRAFRFRVGEGELSFKKISEMPMIVNTVKELAE